MTTMPKDNFSLQFNSVETDPWQTGYIASALYNLGAARSREININEVDNIRLCYDQRPQFRDYHNPAHAIFVGQPDAPESLIEGLSDNFGQNKTQKAKAILSIAGLFHDVAYKHIDAVDDKGNRAWPTVLQEEIGDVAFYQRSVEDGKAIYRTFLTPEGKNDPLTQMVAHIFGMDTEKGIIHNQGGNEFDSALAAAKFLEKKGTPPKSLIAVVAAIAATVPFKPATGKDAEGNIINDGHMGELAERVKTATLPTPIGQYTSSWQDVNDIMRLSVHLANRDVSPFLLPDNFANVVNGGRQIRNEELPVFRRQQTGSPEQPLTIYDILEGATLEASAAFLYKGLSGRAKVVPPSNVPHVYFQRNENGRILFDGEEVKHSYPPLQEYFAAVDNTALNAEHASAFFKAHRAGIALAASFATLMNDPNPLVPGLVDAGHWSEQSVVPQRLLSRLSPQEKAIYEALRFGEGQQNINMGVTDKSPIGGIIFGSLGINKLNALNDQLEQIFNGEPAHQALRNQEKAQQVKECVHNAIGTEMYAVIATEMGRVAKAYQDDKVRGNPDRTEYFKNELETLRQQGKMAAMGR